MAKTRNLQMIQERHDKTLSCFGARWDRAASTGELIAQRLTYSTAMFHFGRGEMDAFYEWLNRAIDERFPEAMYLAADPAFNRERQTPRFQAALRRLGL